MLTSNTIPRVTQKILASCRASRSVGKKLHQTFLSLLCVAVFTAMLPNFLSAQCSMSCAEVNFSLSDAPFCGGTLTVGAILTSSSCDGNDTIIVSNLNDVPIPGSPFIGAAYIGQTLRAKVMNRTTGQSCWNFVHVEYKFPPKLNCTAIDTFNLQCYDALPPSTQNRPTVTSCNLNTVLTSTDRTINIPCGDPTYPNLIRIVERKWVVLDNNSSAGPMRDSCVQRYFFQRVNPSFSIAGITFPPTAILECGVSFIADPNGNPKPIVTGAPSVNGNSIYMEGAATPNSISTLCMLQATYSDQVIPLVGNTKKIVRNWKVFNWCTGTSRDTIQFIEIMDTQAPNLVCPPNRLNVLQTDPLIQLIGSCKVNLFVPSPTISDACSNVWTTVITTNQGRIVPIFTPVILADLPIDSVATVTYTVTDASGNSRSCTWQVSVRDDVPPIPICRQLTKVAIGVFGSASIDAGSFNEGSYDNCSIKEFKVRRLPSACRGQTAYADAVTFECCDAAFPTVPIMVELLVRDNAGNTNSCMVEVLVEDKLPPSLVCPNNLTLNCSSNRSDLTRFGRIVLTPPFKRDTFYINSQGVRSATDNGGTRVIDGLGTDNCNLNLTTTVDSTGLSTCGSGFINRNFTIRDFGGKTLSCTQSITITDPSLFNASNITWPSNITLSNTCGYPDTSIRPVINTFGKCTAQILVGSEDQVFLQGGGPNCLKVLRKWRVIDWCQYVPNSNSTAGYFEYTQEIRVTDNIPPVFTNFPSDIIVDIAAGAAFGCTAVVGSLPTATASDCRPGVVPSVTVAFPAGVSGSGYGPYSNVPVGSYIATYRAEDGCGNVATRTLTITVREKKKPTPVCFNGLSVDLMPTTGMVPVPAISFNAGSYDNCTPQSELKYRIGRAQGPNQTGVPTETSLIFTCADRAAPVQVDMWVGDAFGNWDYCTTYIIVQNNMGANCPAIVGTASIAGAIRTEVGSNVENVSVALVGLPLASVTTGATGAFQFGGLPTGGNVSVTPQKNLDPLNGVSTFDIVKINRHIIGTDLLGSPYSIIAADVNKSGIITTLDMIQLRQLILQRIVTFPSNTSWRFIEKKYVFLDPTKPLLESFPEACAMNP